MGQKQLLRINISWITTVKRIKTLFFFFEWSYNCPCYNRPWIKKILNRKWTYDEHDLLIKQTDHSQKICTIRRMKVEILILRILPFLPLFLSLYVYNMSRNKRTPPDTPIRILCYNHNTYTEFLLLCLKHCFFIN